MDCISGRVMVFGTFDIFHRGHKHFIEQAILEGEHLIIVVARDHSVLKFKNILTNPESHRKRVIQKAFPDLQVVLGDLDDPLAPVRLYKPEKVCLGYDQVGYAQELMDSFPWIEIKRLSSFFPERYKSSKLRQ